jgi:hypothetical protein
MTRRALAVGLLIGTATFTFAPSASAFEPPADPQNKFTCPGGDPVAGHPGFPGITTGVESSVVKSGGGAAAAWSATTLFDGPLAVC